MEAHGAGDVLGFANEFRANMKFTPAQIRELAAKVQTDVPSPIAGARPVTVEHIKVHGVALEGNLEGDEVDRDVFVFLPPSYSQEKSRRYPVVYPLHGFSIGAEQWTHEIHVPQTIEGAFAQGAKEIILVLPDSKTLHNGSMYSSSATTGDFEQFIAATWSHISMRITVQFRIAGAEDSSVTQWEVTALRVSE